MIENIFSHRNSCKTSEHTSLYPEKKYGWASEKRRLFSQANIIGWWNRFCCICPACADKSGGFSPFHSIVEVHPSPPRLPIDFKNYKYFLIFASYYAFVIVFLTWLAYFLNCINSVGFLFIFSFSLAKAYARNVILYYPYRQYTDLSIFRFLSQHSLRSTLCSLKLYSTWEIALWTTFHTFL